MYLVFLNLYNFRRFRGEDGTPGLSVIFNRNLNIIIGENDSGKTAIIDAIRYLLGTASDDLERVTIENMYSTPCYQALIHLYLKFHIPELVDPHANMQFFKGFR